MPEPANLPSPGTLTGENPRPAIPGYDLLRRIGQGSYGEVWLVRENPGGNYRAMKIVYRHTFDHDRPFERELSGIQKFEPVSRTHPSQVHILHVGRNLEAGYFYYVMELADDADAESEPLRKWESGNREIDAPTTVPPGRFSTFSPPNYRPRTLKSELTRRGRLPFNECLNVSLALTTALEHLHANDLIHRDIKPSNVIFVNGVPKLADIGLVTDIGATISHVGTEGFLPPEGPGTPQADLYSLGKVLYEISTGRDRLDFPELPTFVENGAEKENLLELNLIFLKACQNDVRRRYQSAREMFADLTLLQKGKSLRRARVLEQRLARLRLAAAAMGLAAIVIGGAIFLVQQQRVKRADAQRHAEQREKEREKEYAMKMHRKLVDSYISNGESLQASGDISGALVWFGRAFLEESLASTNGTPWRDFMERAFEQCRKVPVLVAHRGAVNMANWSSDGRRIVTASEDRTVQVWDAETGQPVGQQLGHDAPVRTAELSPDGSRVLTLSRDGVATIWDLSAGTALPFASGIRVNDAFLSPNGSQVLTITDDPEALLWESGSARKRFSFRHEGPLHHAGFSSDGRLVATASADGTVRVWQTASGEPVTASPLVEGSPVNRVAFSPDARRLLTVSGRRVRVWNVRSGEPAFFALSHDANVKCAVFNPSLRLIATATEDDTVQLWNSLTAEPLRQFAVAKASVQDLTFSPDGHWLAVATADRVQLIDVTRREVSVLTVHTGPVRTVRFSPSGQLVLTGSDDRTARLTAVGLSSWTFFSASSASSSVSIKSWTEFLSGRRISDSQKLLPLNSDTLRELWSALRAADPSDFALEDAPAWHAREAEKCERSGDWFAARFHWAKAADGRPANRELAARRERAERALAEQELAATRPSVAPRRIPPRPPGAKANQIDLSAFYNAALTESWLPTNAVPFGNDLSALPRGLQKFGGLEFDVRGLVQLSGSALENLGGRFPQRIDGVPVQRKFRRLHLVHGAAWNALSGTHIGSYSVHYANGEEREVKIIFGHNIRDWWFSQTQPLLTTGAAIAWEGANPASQALGQRLRLYQMAWVNPLPDIEVRSLDFKSTMEKPAPFLIAITVE